MVEVQPDHIALGFFAFDDRIEQIFLNFYKKMQFYTESKVRNIPRAFII